MKPRVSSHQRRSSVRKNRKYTARFLRTRHVINISALTMLRNLAVTRHVPNNNKNDSKTTINDKSNDKKPKETLLLCR